MTPANDNPCELHEQQIQENSKKIAELETRADYKDKRIDELNNKMDKIESKLDNLTDTVNSVVVNSISSDNDLNNRVIALETKLQTQNDAIDKYKKEQREQRDEDRQKANQRLTYLGIGLTCLTIFLAYILPYLLK